MNLKIIYEDNHLIAVVKPAGILSQPDATGDPSLYDQVKSYLKETKQKPGNVFLGLLHRLDRPASGLVLFAKTSKGAARLSEQFRNQTVMKTYHVLVHGTPPRPEGDLVSILGKDVKTKKAKAFDDGRQVSLHYRVVASAGARTLLEVQIFSGVFHQIRAQLALAGLPVVGDAKYGSKEPAKHICLCATGLGFTTATGDRQINLRIEPPAEWIPR